MTKLGEFRWIPGQGMDAAALENLRGRFGRPPQSMGEAWFMSDSRKMYPELMGDLDKLPAEAIQKPMMEIAGGFSAFGALDGWGEWYHYLLPRMLPRWNDRYSQDSVVETLISCFCAIYPEGVHAVPYRHFREDVLLTLGRCLMETQCWNGEELAVGEMLHRNNFHPNGVSCWGDASGDFSASVFFCLKYLPQDLVSGWFQSVLEIRDPHWRVQLMVWAIGAHAMLTGEVKWPEQFNVWARPSVTWHESHCLRSEMVTEVSRGATPMPPFLPDASREQALHRLRTHFTEDVFLEWLDSISRVDYLYSELNELPEKFERLFVGKRKIILA